MAVETFHPLRIAEARRETADALSVRFEVPDALAPAFRFRAGQHVTLRAVVDGEELRRNYSVCAAPHEGLLRVGIKAISGGRFSGWANRELKPGHVIEVMPPHGSFTWAFDPARRGEYLGIAGGSGITPILSLLKTALIEEPSSRFTLLYGNRHSHAVMFLDEIAALKDRFLSRLAAYHFLEDEADAEVPLFDGRLDRAKLDTLFPALVDPAGIDAAFVCGPGPMMDAAETALLARGLPRERILIERFTVDRPNDAQAAALQARAEAAAGLTFTATLGGRRRARIAFDPALGNLLDSARAAGLPAPYACKAGVCATCRARVTAGGATMAVHYGLTEAEVAAGYVLTCQAVPDGPGLVLDYDG